MDWHPARRTARLSAERLTGSKSCWYFFTRKTLCTRRLPHSLPTASSFRVALVRAQQTSPLWLVKELRMGTMPEPSQCCGWFFFSHLGQQHHSNIRQVVLGLWLKNNNLRERQKVFYSRWELRPGKCFLPPTEPQENKETSMKFMAALMITLVGHKERLKERSASNLLPRSELNSCSK